MNAARIRATGRSAVCLLAMLLIAPQPSFAQAPPASALGPLRVRVTSAGSGAPAANAIVCVGTAGSLAQFHHGQTDSLGSVRFASIPQQPFVVTASLAGRGGQAAFAAVSPNVPVLDVRLVLPASGGPSCVPATAGGASPIGPATGTIRSEAIERLRNAPTLPPPPTVTQARTEFCFGAVGAQCGQPQTGLPATAACAAGTCFINGGSWEHDECCFRNRHVAWCELDPARMLEASGNPVCTAAWNKAVRLTTKGLSWARRVDFARGNRSGTVEFTLYCAPPGTLLPPEDGDKCCSRLTRPLAGAELAVAVAAQEPLRACR